MTQEKTSDDSVSPKHADTAEPPWMERSVTGLLRLLGGSVTTFLDLLFRPWRSKVHAADNSPAAPPISFLIVGLLFAGLATRAFVLYLTRTVDIGVVSVVTEAVNDWGPQEILLVTLPVVTLIVMAGLGTARWTRWSGPAFQNPIVRGVCYASGFQVVGIGVFTTGIIGSKFFRGHDRVANQFLGDGPLLLLVGFLILSGAFQIERVLKVHGRTVLSRVTFLRGGLSVVTSTTVFVGVVTTGIFSFDLFSVVAQSQKEYLQTEFVELGESGVHVSAIESDYSETADGYLRIEQTFLLANYSQDRWAVPRPSQLKPIVREGQKPSLSEPLPVESCSIDWSTDAGWILAPEESRIVKWSVLIPPSVRASRTTAVGQMIAAEADIEDYYAVNGDAQSGIRPIWVLLDWSDAAAELAATKAAAHATPVSSASLR